MIAQPWRGAFYVLGSAYIVNALGWFLYQRFGSQQPRELSPRYGALPHNIIPPRSRWQFRVAREATKKLYLHAWFRPRRDFTHEFQNSYVVKWPSVDLLIIWRGVRVQLLRRTERWAS